MKQIAIDHEVQIKEIEALAEYWRQRALAYAQLCHVQQDRIATFEASRNEIGEKNGD